MQYHYIFQSNTPILPHTHNDSMNLVLSYHLQLSLQCCLLQCIKMTTHTGRLQGKAVTVHSVKIYIGSKGIAPCIIKLHKTRWCLANFVSQPFYLCRRTPELITGSWLTPSASLNLMKKGKISCSCQDSNPRLPSSQPSHDINYTISAPRKLQAAVLNVGG